MEQLINKNGILEVPEIAKYVPDNSGYGIYCFNKMKEFSQNIAQINTETNESNTYGDILKKSIRVALKLQSLGIKKNDVISLCTNNHNNTCIPYFGSIFIGAILSNLDPSLSLSDMIYLTNLAKPKVIFCISESVDFLKAAIKENNLSCPLVVFEKTTKHISFDSFLEAQNNEDNFEPVAADSIFDTLFILFSSGTTGLAKGICVTQYSILYSSSLFSDYNLTTSLFYSSPYWISYCWLLTGTLMCGGKRLLCKTFNQQLTVKFIQDYKVSFMFLPPFYTYEVLAANKKGEYDTSSLFSMLIGGGITIKEQHLRLKEFFDKTIIINGYGLTEVNVFSTFNPKKDTKFLETKLNSCGFMISGTSCKIVDPETKEILGPNQPGELLIKSKRLMNGYYNNLEETKKAYDEEGFLKTGDIVYYDEDYCFYVVNRIKEMFKYRTWHIMPTELESILLKHPAVKEVMVIGRPHEGDGDHPMAVIIRKDGFNVTEDEILQFFNKEVIDRKRLRGGVKFVKSFPLTPTGKYNRVKLRSMILNNEIL